MYGNVQNISAKGGACWSFKAVFCVFIKKRGKSSGNDWDLTSSNEDDLTTTKLRVWANELGVKKKNRCHMISPTIHKHLDELEAVLQKQGKLNSWYWHAIALRWGWVEHTVFFNLLYTIFGGIDIHQKLRVREGFDERTQMIPSGNLLHSYWKWP